MFFHKTNYHNCSTCFSENEWSSRSFWGRGFFSYIFHEYSISFIFRKCNRKSHTFKNIYKARILNDYKN